MKYIYSALVLFLLPVLSNAQVEGLLHNKFGIRAGANLSTLNNSPSGDRTTPKGGFYVSGYYQFRLRHNIGLLAEAAYSRLGCTNNYNQNYWYGSQQIGQPSLGQTALCLNYFTVPVSLKFYITENYSLQMGLYGSALLNAVDKGSWTNTISTSNGYQTQIINYNQPLSNYFSSFDGGVHIGLGFETEEGINFALKYYNSFTNNSKNFEQTTGKSLHNAFFQLTVGYSFGIH